MEVELMEKRSKRRSATRQTMTEESLVSCYKKLRNDTIGIIYFCLCLILDAESWMMMVMAEQ